MVVLDIMGVQGFDLLKIAGQRNIPAMMLTLDGKHLATIRDGDLWRLYLRKGLAP